MWIPAYMEMRAIPLVIFWVQFYRTECSFDLMTAERLPLFTLPSALGWAVFVHGPEAQDLSCEKPRCVNLGTVRRVVA